MSRFHSDAIVHWSESIYWRRVELLDLYRHDQFSTTELIGHNVSGAITTGAYHAVQFRRCDLTM